MDLILRGGSLFDRTGAPSRVAHVAVFDPNTVNDMATSSSPHKYARGFELVMVNRQKVLEGVDRTVALPGMVLRGFLAKPNA